MQGANHRQDARELFVGAHRLGARPRRLAADIDQIGAVGLHADAFIGGRRRIEARAALGERIGGDVQDAHDEASGPESKRAAGWERDREMTPGGGDHVIKNLEFGIWNARPGFNTNSKFRLPNS